MNHWQVPYLWMRQILTAPPLSSALFRIVDYFLTYNARMSRTLKIFLLWLVMLALPAQGFASAMMMDCGSTHHHAMMGQSVPRDHGAPSHNGVVVDQSHAGGDHATGKHISLTKCSACAGCCLGTAAPPATIVIMVPVKESGTIHLSPEKRFSVNFPDGLERPPHSLTL